ncbi:hypothetical protein L1887_44508 [Cichorium endivia]|nr:hypothetical protein L1887_44508 [Cichorium endivia]
MDALAHRARAGFNAQPALRHGQTDRILSSHRRGRRIDSATLSDRHPRRGTTQNDGGGDGDTQLCTKSRWRDRPRPLRYCRLFVPAIRAERSPASQSARLSYRFHRSSQPGSRRVDRRRAASQAVERRKTRR